MVVQPAYATSACEDAFGLAASPKVGRVDFLTSGTSVNNTRGMAVDMDIYNSFEMPGNGIPGYWSWFVMYIFNAADPDDYVEFGWTRHRNVFGYDAPYLQVVKTDDGLQTNKWNIANLIIDDIDVATKRLKFFHSPGDDKWHFYLGDPGGLNYVEYLPGGVLLDDWDGFRSGIALVTTEVNNSCNASVNEYIDGWRYSGTNLSWIPLGNYDVGFHLVGADTNNHIDSYLPGGAVDNYGAACTHGGGCYYFSAGV